MYDRLRATSFWQAMIPRYLWLRRFCNLRQTPQDKIIFAMVKHVFFWRDGHAITNSGYYTHDKEPHLSQ